MSPVIHGGHVLDHHGPIVGPLERGDVRGHTERLERRAEEIGLREDQHPARVEQDRADPPAHMPHYTRGGVSVPRVGPG